jgi:hypothetical protein
MGFNGLSELNSLIGLNGFLGYTELIVLSGLSSRYWLKGSKMLWSRSYCSSKPNSADAGEGRRKTVRSQKSQMAALVSSREPALSGYLPSGEPRKWVDNG